MFTNCYTTTIKHKKASHEKKAYNDFENNTLFKHHRFRNNGAYIPFYRLGGAK